MALQCENVSEHFKDMDKISHLTVYLKAEAAAEQCSAMSKIATTSCRTFWAKMYQIQFRMELCHRPCWGSSECSQDLAGWVGTHPSPCPSHCGPPNLKSVPTPLAVNWALIVLGLALCLPSTPESSVFTVLCTEVLLESLEIEPEACSIGTTRIPRDWTRSL